MRTNEVKMEKSSITGGRVGGGVVEIAVRNHRFKVDIVF